MGLILLTGLFLWLAYPVASSVWYINRHITEGRGYTAKKWVNSQLMEYLETHPAAGKVYYTNRQPDVWLRLRVAFKGLPDQRDMDKLRESGLAGGGEVYIAYFYDNYGRESLLPQIESLGFEPMAEFYDGILYRCCEGDGR